MQQAAKSKSQGLCDIILYIKVTILFFWPTSKVHYSPVEKENKQTNKQTPKQTNHHDDEDQKDCPSRPAGVSHPLWRHPNSDASLSAGSSVPRRHGLFFFFWCAIILGFDRRGRLFGPPRRGRCSHLDGIRIGVLMLRRTYVRTPKRGRSRTPRGFLSGHRETCESPGMPWRSTGSGVYHAEGGANARGERMPGCVYGAVFFLFVRPTRTSNASNHPLDWMKIWISVPSDKKLVEPRYGTVQPNGMPLVQVSKHCTARVLAGNFKNVQGPFTTVQPVQMMDLELNHSTTSKDTEEGSAPLEASLQVAEGMDTAILFVYEGSLESLNECTEVIPQYSVILLDASDQERRAITIKAKSAASVMLLAGKRLNQEIAWQGPIVMTDDFEIANTMSEIRGGFFPPVCVEWDYKRIASKASDA